MNCSDMKDFFWHLEPYFFVEGPTKTKRASPESTGQRTWNTHSHNQRLYPTSGHLVFYPLLDINEYPECNQHKEYKTVSFFLGHIVD